MSQLNGEKMRTLEMEIGIVECGIVECVLGNEAKLLLLFSDVLWSMLFSSAPANY